jgi:hypothetical protein
MQQSLTNNYQQCVRCIMDISAADIFFDAKGICNFCTEFLSEKSNIIFEDKKKKRRKIKIFY